MRNGPVKWWALAAILIAAPALAQDMPDIGFQSVGRGRPLAASVHDQKRSAPAGFGRPVSAARRRRDELDGFRPDALPAASSRCRVDIFTSTDFYADKALWSDPRYFRCNSPMATEFQRGILTPNPLVTTGKTEDGPWGHCEIDYPREAIVSPYGFKTAQEHYEALLEETRGRGGPNVYTFEDFPAVEWNGVYERPVAARATNRPGTGARTARSRRILSLLTPEYQQRTVQEAYHQVRGNAIWPSTFCWPEGFMRRYYPFSVWEHYDHRHAGSRAGHGGSRAQLHHEHSRRTRVQHGRRRERRRAALGPCRAALVRRHDRFLGRRRADHLDEQRAGLEVALLVRVVGPAAVDRDLHADPRRAARSSA